MPTPLGSSSEARLMRATDFGTGLPASFAEEALVTALDLVRKKAYYFLQEKPHEFDANH